MNDNSTLKIAGLIGFLAFAAVSCWATTESLHLLLPSWPIIFCWAITIGFFFIASWGTKMIVDSLNQNVYMGKRGLNLIGGTLIVLVFWLLCSMPTNTHTFFYRNLVNQEVTSDIETTEYYLYQIKNNTNNEEQAKIQIQKLYNDLEILLGELEAEIKNSTNPGFGPKAEEIFNKFAKLLGVAKIDPLNAKANSVKEREALCQEYRKKMYTLAQSKANNIVQSIMKPNPSIIKDANTCIKNLDLVKKYIDSRQIDLNDADDIKDVCDKLNKGYSTINNNQQFVNFKTEQEKEDYTRADSKTKVSHLLSVYDVWMDFFSGKKGGLSFVFWIFISILVDIAAFVFFDMAFKKRD